MAERPFRPARRAGTTIPTLRSMKYKTGEAIIVGSPTVTDANGEQTLCGADPVTIRGIACQAADTNPGFEVANESQVISRTGRKQEIVVCIAEPDVEFSGAMYAGAAGAIDTPAQTHIGEQYGIVKRTASNVWVIDSTDTVNVAVEITDIVEAQGGDPGFFLFKVLESVQEA